MEFPEKARPTVARIDLDRLGSNFRRAKDFIGKDISYMAVVKADAYGHGASRCALRLEADGVDWFGVAIPEEGVALRAAGVKVPILCLGSYWPGQQELVVDNSLTPVVFTTLAVENLAKVATERDIVVDVHVKIDTGMGRVGIRYEDAADFASYLKSFANIRVTGLMTHFASAEDPAQNEFTKQQIARFKDVEKVFRSAGHDPHWMDLANSPGAISHPDSRGNLVRLGGALYGLIDDIMPRGSVVPDLDPVLSLVSRIAYLKNVPAGETLGYGRTFETKSDSIIGLVPVGYADGFPRGWSNVGRVCVRETFAPVVGRISMDWTLIDVTDIQDVTAGDEVFLIGSSGECSITAADIAREVGTIGYEITCGIAPRVPRIYLENK